MGGGQGPKEEGDGWEVVWVLKKKWMYGRRSGFLRGRRWMGGGLGPKRKEMDGRWFGS